MLSAGVTAAGVLGVFVASQVNNDGSEGDELAIGIPAVTAIVIGPSLGHWYSGRILHPGMAIRLAGAAVAVGASAYYAGCDGCTETETYIVVGLGLYGAGTLYEIIDSSRSARAYNRRHGLGLQIAPSYVPAATGASAGLSIGGRF